MIETDLPSFVRDILASVPTAGEGVNNWLFRAARVLHAYRSESEIIAILEVSAFGCGRPLKPGEIERAVQNSKTCAYQPGHRPADHRHVAKWPNVNTEQVEAIAAQGMSGYDLWEQSPVRFTSGQPQTSLIIDALFPGDPLLCVGKSNSVFATRPRSIWAHRLSSMQLIVPSPMSARTGLTKDGRESEHTLENTGPRRFLVVEFDQGDTDTHAALLWHLAQKETEKHAPLALVVHSGSKSLHGWFYCVGQSDERLLSFMRYAVSLGADKATWTRSQFVRVPDGTRANGNRQGVLFFNPEVIK